MIEAESFETRALMNDETKCSEATLNCAGVKTDTKETLQGSSESDCSEWRRMIQNTESIQHRNLLFLHDGS